VNRHVIPFAGYPIYVLQSEFILNDEELNFLRNLEYTNHNSKTNLNTRLSSNTDILQLDDLKRLKEFIKSSLDDYVLNILEIKNKFSLCQSWSTIQTEGVCHPDHSHPNHLISSVYYAKAKETKLTFNIPRSIIQDGYYFQYDIKNYNVYNSTSYTIPLKTGDIIFFPGQLNHESSINQEKERIAVGSSFFIDGKIGNKGYISNIDITNNKNIKY
jgi:ectoine hydroxylase-related dioxygenase (phytanoyl-CoA dioxygenase family)